MKWLALLLLGAGHAAGCAHAQGLTLSPVMLTAPAEGGPSSLTFTSGLTAPKTVQVRVFDWSQAGGGEQMTPSADVKFGPEIFEIAPGKTQTVRFLLPDTDGEGSWRVVVDELPSAADTAAGTTQLSLRLRYVLSMFAAPEGDADLFATADGITGQIIMKESGYVDVEVDGAMDKVASEIDASGSFSGQNVPLEAVRSFSTIVAIMARTFFGA